MAEIPKQRGEPGYDAGADRETRRRPCIKTTWCVLDLDHEEACQEVPRTTKSTPWTHRAPDLPLVKK